MKVSLAIRLVPAMRPTGFRVCAVAGRYEARNKSEGKARKLELHASPVMVTIPLRRNSKLHSTCLAQYQSKIVLFAAYTPADWR
jgi:hypothetical protein